MLGYKPSIACGSSELSLYRSIVGQASFSKENGGKRTRPARCARDHDVDALLYMRVGISKAFQNAQATATGILF